MPDAITKDPAPVKTKLTKGRYKPVNAKRCTAKNKNCRDCGFRYPAGSKKAKCPKCGEERRCGNKKIKGRATCRMHGSKGGSKPGRKYTIAKNIEDAYNRVLGSPEAINLSQEIGIAGARVSQLNALLDEGTEAANYLAIREAHATIQRAAISSNLSMINKGIAELDIALAPIEAQSKLWIEINEQLEMVRRLQATNHKWLKDSDQMVTMNEVVEILSDFTRMVFKYLSPKDRSKFAKECRDRGYAPNGKAPSGY